MVKNMLPTGRRRRVAALLSVAWLAFAGPGAPAAAAADQRVVVDWRTGLALYGLDPVTYFAAAEPAPGLPAFEFAYAGAVWRFRNEGNRAAFAAAPAVYAPRFGGYDPIALARGVTTPGNPLVWLVFDKRLYLFYAPASRAAFVADPQRAIAAGLSYWRTVREGADITGALPPSPPAPAAPPPADPPRR